MRHIDLAALAAHLREIEAITETQSWYDDEAVPMVCIPEAHWLELVADIEALIATLQGVPQ